METMLLQMIKAFLYVGISALFIWVAKHMADKLSDGDSDHKIEEENNTAVGLRRAGLYLGVGIGMIGSLSGSNGSFANEVLLTIWDGVLISVFLVVARFVSDMVLLPAIDNDHAIQNGNVAVGLIEAGGYVATGLIAYASFTGEGGPWWSTLVYFVLGQVALLIIMRLYEFLTPWAVIDEVKKGNAAAGLMLASIMIATGFILKGAIAGPFGGWAHDLQAFALSLASGAVMLMVAFHHMVDKVFFKGTDLKTEIVRDQNIAAIAVVSSVKIALALAIGAVVI